MTQQSVPQSQSPQPDPFFTVDFTVKVSQQRVKDLLSSALEGGSDYWVEGLIYAYPKGKSKKDYPDMKYRYLELPFIKDCAVNIVYTTTNDGSGKQVITSLNLKSIESGLRTMASKYYDQFNLFLQEQEDANTGDLFLQCCLFNELQFS